MSKIVLLVVPMVIVVDEDTRVFAKLSGSHPEEPHLIMAPPCGEGEGLTLRTKTTGWFAGACWIASAISAQLPPPTLKVYVHATARLVCVADTTLYSPAFKFAPA